ncbi:peroxiredoxin-1 isoform X1 [Erpetoichthys calabaricus]|uniref:peroxiredoxin-1 isoform X1 n=1 Tax=Erpetoichthys calabaricus TaxID=27687 RepID=UPI0022343D50|nr:peroxiredoxin-1 isoform X1 [Erpetoichthys calabaricus]
MSAGNAHIGKPAPNFKATAVMPDKQFKDIQLSDYRGKYVVFFFYPLDFTFVCPTEIIAFSDRADEFKKINCEVIGASVDSHFCHLAWINTPRKQGGLGQMNIPLVADTLRTIAKDYGVLKEDEGIAFRGLFIVDDKGILRQITINDLPVGRSVDETLRLVQAFQFTDKHGEEPLTERTITRSLTEQNQITIQSNSQDKVGASKRNDENKTQSPSEIVL